LQPGFHIQGRGRATGEHRVDHFRRGPVGAFQQQAAQSFGDEIVHLQGDSRPVYGLRRFGFFEQGRQFEVQPALQNDPQHAKRGPTQAERILGAGGTLLDGEDSNHGIELVGQRQRLTGLGSGQRVSCISRSVVFLDRLRQFGGFALCEGVVLAHGALQFRELAHHGGHEISLRQLRGAHGIAWSTYTFGDVLRQSSNPCGLLRITAQFRLKRDLAQARRVRLQRKFAVLVPEERGIAQPWPDHPFIALAYLGGIPALNVAHGNEAAGQCPIGASTGKYR